MGRRRALPSLSTSTSPCICEQMDTTLVVPEGWTIHVDGYHNLKIKDEVN